mmetsp:Transcript_3711/g.13424  ORF Transcript_3711/g.13424 Transcript_3711/m.13424 type:complete len:239 (+) Transcript_3711:1619-2335(+)
MLLLRRCPCRLMFPDQPRHAQEVLVRHESAVGLGVFNLDGELGVGSSTAEIKDARRFRAHGHAVHPDSYRRGEGGIKDEGDSNLPDRARDLRPEDPVVRRDVAVQGLARDLLQQDVLKGGTVHGVSGGGRSSAPDLLELGEDGVDVLLVCDLRQGGLLWAVRGVPIAEREQEALPGFDVTQRPPQGLEVEGGLEDEAQAESPRVRSDGLLGTRVGGGQTRPGDLAALPRIDNGAIARR